MRLRRILARLALLLAVLAAVAAALIVWAVRPPGPLPAPARGVSLGSVTLVEPGGLRRGPVRIETQDGRIATIGPASAPLDAFAGATVLPGLTDMHAHFPATGLPGDEEYTALLMLAHGVTAVRLTGGAAPAEVARLRARIEAGELPGPRLFTCGPIIDGPNPVVPIARSVGTPAEAAALVDELAAQGADCIKAYDQLDQVTLEAIRSAAHRHGLPLIGHTPQALSFEAARLDDVQHLRGVHPPFEGEDLSYPHFLGAWRRLDDDWLAHVTRVSRAHGIAHTPTLVAIEGTVVSRDWSSWRATPGMQLWPPHLRDGVWSGEVGFGPARFASDADIEMVREATVQMARTARALHEAGIPLHTGTDANAPNLVPGVSLHRELELWVAAGIPVSDALSASTRRSPAFLGIEGAGTLVEGAPADFVIYRDDPTEDLAALRTLLGVVRDGRLYTRADLDARLARYRAHYEGPAFQRVVMPPLRLALRTLTDWLRGRPRS